MALQIVLLNNKRVNILYESPDTLFEDIDSEYNYV